MELDISDKLSEVEKNDLITSACKKLLVNEIIEEYEVLG
ncbi:phosphoribosylformylglycinamidine synthase subunit PurS [Alphaproteobacteria bacterium]|nr:phosphoribosylformylglycinamidine synthase subunit PurS [Alphaproteobacteria bacterium]